MCISRYLVLSFWLVLFTGFVGCSGTLYAEEKAGIGESEGTMSRLEGRICDPNGAPVAWTQVRYFYYSGTGEKCPFEGSQRDTSDEKGRYSFMVPGGMTYHVQAGGHNATAGMSKKFSVRPGEAYEVETITVRPARSSVRGVVVDAKGNPVPDMEFAAYSRSFEPTGSERNPYTRMKGEFHLSCVLPDEPLAFCVIISRNTVQIWKNIKPDSQNLRLILEPEKGTELPPGWRFLGGLRMLALASAYVEDTGLSFNLHDRAGMSVSLSDKRYVNKVVLVNIWGTWCGMCAWEIPHLIQMQKKYAGRGFEIIGIAFERDDSVAGWKTFKSVVKEKGINYTILKGGLASRANVEAALVGLKGFSGYPTTILIDRNGKSKHVQVGFFGSTPERKAWQVCQMEKRIEKLLGN